jgi:hypothetical protein
MCRSPQLCQAEGNGLHMNKVCVNPNLAFAILTPERLDKEGVKRLDGYVYQG